MNSDLEGIKIENFYSIVGRNHGYIRQLNIRRVLSDDGIWDLVLELSISSSLKVDDGVFGIFFYGVRDLKVGRIEDLVKILLDMREVDAQIEGCRYRIVENEYDSIGFMCRDFSF